MFYLRLIIIQYDIWQLQSIMNVRSHVHACAQVEYLNLLSALQILAFTSA